MDLDGKTIVITGGASGIGRALARRFSQEGAAHVAVADLDAAGAEAVAAEIGGSGHGIDVTDAAAIEALVETVETNHGGIDLFCSNAGIAVPGGLDGLDSDWERVMAVNVTSHLYAARAVVPRMIERGGGYLLNTASAAGLLAQIGSLTYSVSKHAAVSLAEWISITHGGQGIKVSVLCPQAVNTPMIAGTDSGGVEALHRKCRKGAIPLCGIR